MSVETVIVPISLANATVEAPSKPSFDQVGEFLGDLFKRLFSEARALARMKMLAFTSFLGFVGLGFVLRLSDFGAGGVGTRVVEFILASPTTAQAVVALLALLFVLLANIYSRLKRQEWEKELLRLAADPSTPEEVRRAILRRLG